MNSPENDGSDSSAQREKREMGKATGVLASSTLASRLLGLVRNQVLAVFFGAGFQSDAFIAAFTLPNALRRLFGEGALTPSFVSLFTRLLPKVPNERSTQEWQSFLSACFFWLLLIVGFTCVLGMFFAPQIVFVYVPHFLDEPGKFELTVQLARLLFPFILLISVAAFFMGVLNSFGRFFLPAIGPAVLNLCVILIAPLGILYFLEDRSWAIYLFASSFLVGAFVQLLIQIPLLRKLKALPQLFFKWNDKRVAELGLLLAPALLSMGVHQLNIIVNRIFASDIPGAVSHLFYADLIIELPVSLIATSMATAAVPSFSRLAAQNDRRALGEAFSFSMGTNLMLSLPATAGALILGAPMILSIFSYGEFSFEDAQVTIACLFFYSLGLPFFCSLRSLLPLYFAEKDTRTPALVGVVALVVNFYFAWKLSQSMGAPGIALATSLSSFVNFSLLCLILMRRYPLFPWLRIAKDLFVLLTAASLMGGALFLGLELLNWSAESFYQKTWYVRGLEVLGMVSAGGLFYFSILVIFRVPYVQFITKRIFKRR